MNHRLAADLMRKHTYGLAMAILFALTITPHAHAESDEPSDTQGQWHNNVQGVSQTASVSPSINGVAIDIGIIGQNEGASGSPGLPGGVINENPRGPRGGSGPGFSLPPLLPPTGGANIIVPGGPMSFETQLPNGPTRGFGGVSVGGWTFDTPGTAGVTTPFAPIGPVPQINAWDLALRAEQEFPLPPITLKVNPDPGRVNVDSWFWVEGYDGSMITHSKTQHASHTECRLLNGVSDCRLVDDSVTVVVHLSPKNYGWTFGDDRNNAAAFGNRNGLGRAYTDPDPRNASPVAHAYHWSSINFLEQGGYPISLTVTWSAEFSANGGGFQGIPDVNRTFDGRHQVRQIQSIVQQ